MRLLYIVNRIDGPGGLERVLSIKASYFAEQYTYDVHVVTLNQKETDLFYDFSSRINFHNINAKGNPVSYLLQYRKGIRKTIDRLEPDIVLVCDDGLKGLFLPIITGKKYPMIYERHVSKSVEIKKDKNSGLDKLWVNIKFRLMNFSGGRYDSFVVLTHGNAKEWHLKNIKIIPNPLSFFPDKKQLSSLENKKVLAVGKHSFQKGYDRLLKSWQKVQESNPSWVLDIYGTIDKEQGLEALAEQLNISKTVNFYGPVKDIGQKYSESSLYVMSSRYEGFGMVLTEAMAYSVPCISFDCPFGPSDIIQHENNGILVENNDIAGLASAICELISDKDKRIKMGRQARKDVQQYLPEQIAAKWDLLFKNLTRK
ncbi:glycosyltransferase family 4 protein [Costertonia aggregata]|uniref:Glycosyltransferase family 4 protein n=1 Tax=Costertonia aggregata TaxID=343403 RepID=A0A7H9ATD0_9FLAO|nr:glycosyltransferase family 4 protein [Costertonia aggregata]QLG46700.1 glycosyltransferase family 4 protein [Costertonia aggregata]